jgi:transcriptional regulator with XRE-family HTH domain
MRIPMETWSDYVRRVAGTLTHAQIAQKSGVASSNVGRWLRGEPGLPRAETVIAFARSFNESPMEAMVAAGYFTHEEATSDVRTPLSEYTYAELIAELQRRNPERD